MQIEIGTHRSAELPLPLLLALALPPSFSLTVSNFDLAGNEPLCPAAPVLDGVEVGADLVSPLRASSLVGVPDRSGAVVGAGVAFALDAAPPPISADTNFESTSLELGGNFS